MWRKKTMEKFPSSGADRPSQLCGVPGAILATNVSHRPFLLATVSTVLFNLADCLPSVPSGFAPRQRWKYLRISKSDRVNWALSDIEQVQTYKVNDCDINFFYKQTIVCIWLMEVWRGNEEGCRKIGGLMKKGELQKCLKMKERDVIGKSWAKEGKP